MVTGPTSETPTCSFPFTVCRSSAAGSTRLILSSLFSSRILNFFYKNIIGVGVLFFFQIYCAWSSTYVFEYVYLLLWNVVWSLAPVIAM